MHMYVLLLPQIKNVSVDEAVADTIFYRFMKYESLDARVI